VFSEEELAGLRSFPEIGRVELIAHFTLTGADEAFVRKFRTERNGQQRATNARRGLGGDESRERLQQSWPG